MGALLLIFPSASIKLFTTCCQTPLLFGPHCLTRHLCKEPVPVSLVHSPARCSDAVCAPGWTSPRPAAPPHRASTPAPLSWWPLLNSSASSMYLLSKTPNTIQYPDEAWHMTSRGPLSSAQQVCCQGSAFTGQGCHFMGTLLAFSSLHPAHLDHSPSLMCVDWSLKLAVTFKGDESALHYVLQVTETY